jgi:hypothetical protein
VDEPELWGALADEMKARRPGTEDGNEQLLITAGGDDPDGQDHVA